MHEASSTTSDVRVGRLIWALSTVFHLVGLPAFLFPYLGRGGAAYSWLVTAFFVVVFSGTASYSAWRAWRCHREILSDWSDPEAG